MRIHLAVLAILFQSKVEASVKPHQPGKDSVLRNLASCMGNIDLTQAEIALTEQPTHRCVKMALKSMRLLGIE
jgi:hypothetical protein